MKSTLLVLMLVVASSVFGADKCEFKSDAESAAVEKLIVRLNSKEETIKELAAQNIELMIEKIRLDEARIALSDTVISLKKTNAALNHKVKVASLEVERQKNHAVHATKVAYKKVSKSAELAAKDAISALQAFVASTK